MHQDFRITAIDTDLQKKAIIVESTFDIDPETVNNSNFVLMDRLTRNEVELDFKVDGKTIIASLLAWPTPNVDYILRIEKLTNVLGEELSTGVRRKIQFESEIVSKVKVTFPANNEVIDDLKVAWDEVADEEHKIGSFYVEVSTENAFHNIIKKTMIGGRHEIDLLDVPKGQYYVRVRAQKDDQYGEWSEVITFLIGENPSAPEPIYNPTEPDEVPIEDDVIFEGDLEIVSTPETGTTPSSILIEFDREIDPDSIENILVIRRSI